MTRFGDSACNIRCGWGRQTDHSFSILPLTSKRGTVAKRTRRSIRKSRPCHSGKVTAASMSS